MRPDKYRNRNKRTQGGYGEQEENVDDMAVAAAFAVQVVDSSSSTTTNTVEKASGTANMEDPLEVPIDDSELPVSSSSDEDEEEIEAKEVQMTKEGSDDEINAKEATSDDDGDDDDDDDESEVDLSEALAKMVNDEDEFDGDETKKSKNQKKNSGPKTEHEVDPYRTPVLELQSKFNIDLAVEQEQVQEKLDEKLMEKAGKIKFHVIEEKTVVVESLVPETTATIGGPLDEGSLLVLKIDHSKDTATVDVNDPNIDNDNHQKEREMTLLPLGKIFEVFGPVNRPLYTVRLDSPLPKKASSTNDGKGNAKQSNVSEDESKNIEKVMDISEAAVVDVPKEKGTSEPAESADPWGNDGQYTKLLKENPDSTVYYVLGEAKTINTAAIVQISGRGCDASNVYDEEVGRNEMEYSDDEQEREAKTRRKQKKKGGGGGIGNKSISKNFSSSNIHRRQPPGAGAAPIPPPSMSGHYPQQQGYPPQHQGYYSYGASGGGYQQPAHPNYAYQPQHLQQHLPYPGHGAPPQQAFAPGQPHHAPPPPPPSFGTHFAPTNGIPPPPPPPPQQMQQHGGIQGMQNQAGGWNSPAQQPQEESDTVYYDYS